MCTDLQLILQKPFVSSNSSLKIIFQSLLIVGISVLKFTCWTKRFCSCLKHSICTLAEWVTLKTNSASPVSLSPPVSLSQAVPVRPLLPVLLPAVRPEEPRGDALQRPALQMRILRPRLRRCHDAQQPHTHAHRGEAVQVSNREYPRPQPVPPNQTSVTHPPPTHFNYT